MSVISKRIAATPKRTTIEAWQIICELVSESSSPARQTLLSVAGAAAAIISDEIVQNTPIILVGDGPRLRFYCVYGEDALSDENCNEEPLVKCPTGNDWYLYLPCNSEDLSWISATLESASPYITAYDKNETLEIEEASENTDALTFDPSIFRNKI